MARFQKVFDESVGPSQAIINNLAQRIESETSGILKLFEDEDFKRRLKELPAKVTGATRAMLGEGWYPCMDMCPPEQIQWGELLKDGKTDEVNSQLEGFYEERVDSIEQNLLRWYPNRAKIISSAFAAHRRGEYELSIPALLTQVDGICLGKHGKAYFIKHQSKGQSAVKAKDVSNSPEAVRLKKEPEMPAIGGVFAEDSAKPTWTMLTEPLRVSSTVHISVNEETDGSDFKRHGILHGRITGYGTKQNGLRAISMLNYFAEILNDFG